MSIDYDVEKTFCVREWLCPNDPHVGSHIRAHVTHYPKYDVDEYVQRAEKNPAKNEEILISTEVSADVTLADCSRSISWNFSIYGNTDQEFEMQIAKNLDKLNRFKKALQEWETNYLATIDEVRANRKQTIQEIQTKLKEKSQ